MNKRDLIGGVAIVGTGIGIGLMKGLLYTSPKMASQTLKMSWGNGDYNGDGHINIDDWRNFSLCLWGPKPRPSGYECWSDTACGVFDIQKDCDMDMADFVVWERLMNGS